MANIVVAYILWLCGGGVGLHHFYLGRDRQAFIWWATFGGCFGLGWIRDLWRIPEYIFAANRDSGYLNEFSYRRECYPVPPFSISRFIGEMIVGFTFGVLTRLCVPNEYAEDGFGWVFAVYAPPLAVAFGVHMVANIQPQKAEFYPWPLIGAYAGLPWLLYDTQNLIYSCLFSAVCINWKAKQWNPNYFQKRGFCKRVFTLFFCGLLYSTLWTVVIYQNASITTKDGEDIPLREAIPNFFNSPAWAETKESLNQLYEFYKVHGFNKLWEELVEKLDPTGETHAYKVLGLEENATEKEIKSRYRQLAKEWHPDKQKDPEKKEEAQERFMEIQKAYEILSKIQSKRIRKNQRNRHSEFQRKGKFYHSDEF